MERENSFQSKIAFNSPVANELIQSAKKAFTLRRIDLANRNISLTRDVTPKSGDLVMAKVTEIGQHTGVQLAAGGRLRIFHGDHLLLAYGNRYAPDQFEAYVPDDLETCQLVAAGGVAGRVVSSSTRVKPPTQVEPVGLLMGEFGEIINLSDGALPVLDITQKKAKVIVSVGASMNAGKTTTAANIINGLSLQGYHVAAAKLTGTGAPGDVNHMKSAGAKTVYDFTDMGHATTFKADLDEIIESSVSLIGHLEATQPDVIVLEIADGLLQSETSGLLKSKRLRSLIDGIVFSAGEAMSAIYGVSWLKRQNLPVIGISGKLSRSPLAIAETEGQIGLPVFTQEMFENNRVTSYLLKATQLASHQTKSADFIQLLPNTKETECLYATA